jgi:DNA-binding NarL/FixJ family response regulator
MLENAGMSVVGEAKDGAEAVALAGKLEPDLIVLDLDMSDRPGVDALQRIAAKSPQVRVVVLTATLEEADVLDVLGAGACGYILKNTPPDELIDSIRQTAGSHVVLSHEVVRALTRHAGANDQAARQRRPSTTGLELTTRE